MIPRLRGEAAHSIYLEFLVELEARGFYGEISSGTGDRIAVATDNSIYQRLPQAVVFPRTTTT